MTFQILHLGRFSLLNGKSKQGHRVNNNIVKVLGGIMIDFFFFFFFVKIKFMNYFLKKKFKINFQEWLERHIFCYCGFYFFFQTENMNENYVRTQNIIFNVINLKSNLETILST